VAPHQRGSPRTATLAPPTHHRGLRDGSESADQEGRRDSRPSLESGALTQAHFRAGWTRRQTRQMINIARSSTSARCSTTSAVSSGWCVCARRGGLSMCDPMPRRGATLRPAQTVLHRTCHDVKSCETIARRLTLSGASRRSGHHAMSLWRAALWQLNGRLLRRAVRLMLSPTIDALKGGARQG
jgi:hypothetical protein